MEEVRKVEGLTLEEPEDQSVELLPDREEMHWRNRNKPPLIHPSAWNKNSRKFGCTILHRPPLRAARMASEALHAA